MNQGSTKSTSHPGQHSILAILFAAAFTLCPLTAAAQTPPPQVQSTPSPTGPQYTIRTRVPLTIVDVNVIDAKGRPVHDLKQSDFTLLEDNQPMKLQSFDEHRTDTAAPAPDLIQQALPPNTFTNSVPTPPNATPITILVIDNTNTPTGTQLMVQKQMLDFVNRMPTGTRVGVFRLSDSLAIVQGITSDRELLKAAILDKKNLSLVPRNQDFDQDTGDIQTHSPPFNGDPCDEIDSTRTASRAEATLSTMRQLARYLSGIPGRKNLIWFSGSFPPQWPPADQAQAGVCYDFTAALNSATDLLARAHVAINSIESRGLFSDNKGQIDQFRTRKLLEEHYNMDLRAEQTGGHAVYTSNDLAGAAESALESGSNFYTLTYVSTNQSLDARFRVITVKVAQPGLHLTYRNGYYAVAPEVDARGHKIDAPTPMQAAMMRGALPATQILFRVKVVESPASATPSTENQPDPKQMHPPYRHFSINYLIDVHGIDFAPAADGNYRGDFEYGVRVYNADGDEIVNSTSKTVNPILIPAVYQSMLRTGANAHRDIDIPATGDYFLRIAVHDLATGRVGSIEIPTASLTPTPAPKPNSAAGAP